MIDLDSSFRSKVRKIKSPTSADFDQTDLNAAYDDAVGKTDDDVRLMQTAEWIASESSRAREHFVDPDLKKIGGRASVILAVAAINNEYLTLADLAKDAIKGAHERGSVALDHIISQPIKSGFPGQTANSADLTEVSVEVAGSWLFDAQREPLEGDSSPRDLASTAIRAMQKYSIQRALNDLWNQALWEGWYLQTDKGQLGWSPGDRPLATLSKAWTHRQESNFMNFPWIDRSAWIIQSPSERRKRIQRTVLKIDTGTRRKIRAGRPPCREKELPQWLVEQPAWKEVTLPNSSMSLSRFIKN